MLLDYRIPVSQWAEDAQFARLVELLSTQPGAADEISLFNEGAAIPYIPLEEVAQSSEVLKQRIAELHVAGFDRVGVNVVVTLGHWDMPWEFIPHMPLQPMVGHDGQEATSCPCPNTPEFRTYTRQRYTLLARARPDFLWVDDDLRMSHHGPTYPCFCPTCLAQFGHGTDREELVAQLNAPENGNLRREWTEFCAASLESLCADIREAVATVDPDIELGLMTIGYSHSTYAGYPIARCTEALGARLGRPGHGYYTDQVPRLLLNKSMDVGRQVREYPPEVEIILYELENYPHVILDKATQTVLNECTMAIMMGCNGIAYNIFSRRAKVLREHEPLIEAVAAERPAWAALVKAAHELPLVGFWPADHPQLMANREVDESGWFWEGGRYDIQRPNQLADMGIPLTTDRQAACGVILAGGIAEAFGTEELRQVLTGSVLLDGDALRVLWDRGLGKWTGVKCGQSLPGGITERLTAHPLNGPYAGDGRDALVSPADRVCKLEPTADGVNDLSHLVRYDGLDAGCCFSAFANDQGGRIAVSTYAPWHRLGGAAKRYQLRSVSDWLTKGKLPVQIEQTVRVAPFVRRSADGLRVCVVLQNMALDATRMLRLRLRACPEQVLLVAPTGAVPLPVERGEGEIVVAVPSIPAWHTAILVGT